MRSSEATQLLRWKLHIKLSEDAFGLRKYETALSAVKELRVKCVYNWEHTREIWLTAKRTDPKIRKILEHGLKNYGSSVSLDTDLGIQVKGGRDRDRFEAVLYCNIHVRILKQILWDIRSFLDRQLEIEVLEKLRLAALDNSSTNRHGWPARGTVHPLSQVWTMSEDSFDDSTQDERFQRMFKLLENDDEQGWKEIMAWPEEDRSAFDEWLDSNLDDMAQEQPAQQSAATDAIMTTQSDTPPSTEHGVKRQPSWRRALKDTGSKWRHRLRPRKRRSTRASV